MSVRENEVISPVSLYYAYAPTDELLRDKLESHLIVLKRQKLLTGWHNRKILPGQSWSEEAKNQLNSATIILLLISSDFLNSDYCYSVEMERALERHRRGEAYVIPIMLRPVDYGKDVPFAEIQGLPRDNLPVTLWNDQDEAFADIAKSIRWMIGRIQNRFFEDQDASFSLKSSPVPTRALTTEGEYVRSRHLQDLAIHYNGILNEYLGKAELLTPMLHSTPRAIANPARFNFRHIPLTETALLPNTSIRSLYDEANSELLILGKPGAGKSTLLVYLAQSLLKEAQQHSTYPLPFIFHLSSWSLQSLPLKDWLAEELFIRYQMPRDIASYYVQNHRMLPLLDALDEVAPAKLSACIDAINAYRRDYQMPVVVCSRTSDYLNQQSRLMLSRAVTIQPLSGSLIDEYLAEAGPRLASVRNLLQTNQVLCELATSPLMLNILTRFPDTLPEKLSTMRSSAELQYEVFAHYFDRMLDSSTSDVGGIPPEQMRTQLIALATHMRKQNQSVFFFERLQPSWLQDEQSKRAYERWAVHLPGAVIGALAGLISDISLAGNPLSNLSDLSIFLLLGALLGWILSTTDTPSSHTQSPKRFDWRKQIHYLRVSACIGGLIGLCSAIFLNSDSAILSTIYQSISPSLQSLFAPINPSSQHILFFGVSFGLVFTVCSFVLLKTVRKSKSRDPLPSRLLTSHFIPKQPPIQNTNLYNTLLVGWVTWLCYGISYSLFYSLCYISNMGASGLILGFFDGLFSCFTTPSYGASLGLVGGFISVLLIGKSLGIQPADYVTLSRQQIRTGLFLRQHMYTALMYFVLIGFSFWCISALIGLLAVLASAEFNPLTYALSQALYYALNIALCYWLLQGFFHGLSSRTIEDTKRSIPNEGIRQSLSNGLKLGLCSAVIVGCITLLVTLMSGFLSIEIYNPSHTQGREIVVNALVTGVLTGICVGLIVGLQYGGLAYLRHYILRFLLAREGSLPFKLSEFFKEATRHLLLFKEDSGYRFIHRVFLDHLADDRGTIAQALTEEKDIVQQSTQPLHVQPSDRCTCKYSDDRPDLCFCPQCGKRK